VAGVDEGVGGQHAGREVGGAQQGPAHLLEDDGELHEAEALAAVLLGDDQALEAELVGHLAPDGRVVALLGVHEAAHLGLGRLALEELPGDAAQLFLLFGEGEVHGSPQVSVGRPRAAVRCSRGSPPGAPAAVCTRVYAQRRGADRRPGAPGQPGRRPPRGRCRRGACRHRRRRPGGRARPAGAGWRPDPGGPRGVGPRGAARSAGPARAAGGDGRARRRAARPGPRRGPGRVSLYVDTLALVRRYLHDRHRPLVLDAMAGEDPWCTSALTRTEAQLVLHRTSVSARQQRALWSALRDEWEAMWVVPIDDRCTARAVELGA